MKNEVRKIFGSEYPEYNLLGRKTVGRSEVKIGAKDQDNYRPFM
jgi:hypothetical protein